MEPLFGTSVRRVEDPRLLTSGGTFVADLDLPGCVVVTYVTSSEAHALLRTIDVHAARAAPGVLDVLLADDLEIGPCALLNPGYPEPMARPLLALDRVRYVGEPIVAIVAEDAASAADAAALVVVDVEPLRPVVGLDEAALGHSLLFPEVGINQVWERQGGTDAADMDAAFAACDVVVNGTFLNPRVAPSPLETRAGAARWDDDGRLTYWSSCQGAHPVRATIAELYGLDVGDVRVIVPDVGGSFGAKARPSSEELLLPLIARRVGRAARWVPNRSDDMVGLGHSRSQRQHVEIGGDRDGTIRALRGHIESDVGAYPIMGPMQAMNTGNLMPGVYRIPNVAWSSAPFVTNSVPVVSYRGAGRPEAAALVERAVDLFAAELDLDPVAVRRHNLIEPDAFPYHSPTDVVYDSGNYAVTLDVALGLVDYDALRAEQARRRASDDSSLLGIGVAMFVDRTGAIGSEYGAVELQGDGSILIRTGSTPYGQGHHTAWAMLASDRLGVPMERITVVHGDTDLVKRGSVTGGSRSAQKAGVAVAQASDALVDAGRAVAATLLEASVDDITLSHVDRGQFHVVGVPSRMVSWSDIAAASVDDPLSCETDFHGAGGSCPYGAYVCVVEVDVDTGAVAIQRMVAVDDAGTILNPLLAEGQVHGGLGQGIAQALFEEFRYDEHGQPLSGNFLDYLFPSAADLPSYECTNTVTPSPNNPLGVKGIAESGTIGAPPAVQSAVIDAVAHLGVRHIDMPLSPEKIWRACMSARR
ncbi:MAG: xanthine dehydrogenase family protein molybdopterin-binding subunit [Acidimicrobiia bacterium]